MREKGSRVALKLGAVAIAMVCGFRAPAAVQVRFEVPEPFRLAGHAFGAGVVSVRSVGSYTPGTEILEVWVGGTCLGMVTARSASAEIPPGHDEAVFNRGNDGRLEMLGYRVAGTPSGRSFRFVTPIVGQASEATFAAVLGTH